MDIVIIFIIFMILRLALTPAMVYRRIKREVDRCIEYQEFYYRDNMLIRDYARKNLVEGVR